MGQCTTTGLTVVLAAGAGTRMRSEKPKALHAVAGRTLLAHVLDRALAAGGSDARQAIAVVMGPGQTAVAEEAKRICPRAEIFVQQERRGTAHAVLAARGAIESAISRGAGPLMVIFVDTPFVRPQTLARLRAAVGTRVAVAVLGFTARDPTGYGRLMMQDGKLIAIREERDASAEERAVTLCNGGLMALDGEVALDILARIDDCNAKREFYLTDAVTVARAMGREAVAIEVEEDEMRGINTKAQLAEAEAVSQQRLRAAALEAGVTMVAPETVFLSADTVLGRDVSIEPYVVFGPGVIVEEGALIRSFSHLQDAHVAGGASIGPFARLRGGTRVGRRVKIGNFVETKAAAIEDGVKINHLAYIGDARVGENSNIGAGTITCNYDGVDKHRTDIGKNAFIGSNSALVAPVSIADGAYVGSGSVITKDVPADALALGRARQVVKPGYAERLRKRPPATKRNAPEAGAKSSR
jgi:bifunctional UDP-N-acetylglucosamine pyrophosphorylase/glucosamine-1-phosphate N-acetyltransferase